MKDRIVEEVRRVREKQAAKFGYDLKKIIADAKRKQQASGRKVVSFGARAVITAGKS